jgi:hypothetical protein
MDKERIMAITYGKVMIGTADFCRGEKVVAVDVDGWPWKLSYGYHGKLDLNTWYAGRGNSNIINRLYYFDTFCPDSPIRNLGEAKKWLEGIVKDYRPVTLTNLEGIFKK